MVGEMVKKWRATYDNEVSAPLTNPKEETRFIHGSRIIERLTHVPIFTPRQVFRLHYHIHTS